MIRVMTPPLHPRGIEGQWTRAAHVLSGRGAEPRKAVLFFVTLSGGSVGFQIGGEATDLIMLITSDRGFQALMDDNFKIGANASAAAGPVGRHAAAATDIQLKADILSYSRSKGAFAGISLDGAGLTQDKDANRDYYGKAIDLQQITTTHSKRYPAPRLLKLLKPYTP
jgi:lipid-binding SYLF domain-containing protein